VPFFERPVPVDVADPHATVPEPVVDPAADDFPEAVVEHALVRNAQSDHFLHFEAEDGTRPFRHSEL
jgi:hypothetical protein